LHSDVSPYETISSRFIHKGKILNLRVDEVLMPDGRKSTREVVEHSGGVAILALTENREAYFVRQYRHPVEESVLEIPAGKLEPGENPVDCAIRELAEEAGVKPGEIDQIALYYSTPGFTSEKLYIYLATKLEEVTRQTQEDEDLEISLIPLEEAVGMARKGEIADGKTLIALLLAADIMKF
jgi:ADP-ribose pyrophosphatase